MEESNSKRRPLTAVGGGEEEDHVWGRDGASINSPPPPLQGWGLDPLFRSYIVI